MVHPTSKERDMSNTETERDAGVAQLVRAAAGGDQKAWDSLVERYAGLVWAVIRGHRLTGADAADASQTTWLRLVEHAHGLQDPARVGAWLATTARRECLRVLRGSGRQIPYGDDLPEPVSDDESVADDLLRNERDAQLWEAFGRLPQRDQALLRMLVADPAPSYREIADALDMPVGSIGPTRARCLERLRREREAVTEGLAA